MQSHDRDGVIPQLEGFLVIREEGYRQLDLRVESRRMFHQTVDVFTKLHEYVQASWTSSVLSSPRFSLFCGLENRLFCIVQASSARP